MSRLMPVLLVAAVLAAASSCKRAAPAADATAPAAAAAAAATAAPAAGEAAKVPDPVATVNGKPIAAAAFSVELDKITQGGARAIPEDRLKKIQENILNRLVEEELLGQEVVAQGVEVAESELDAEFAKYKARFKSDEQFNNYLTHGKTSIDEIRKRLRTSLSLTKLLEKLGKLAVSDEEVRKAYDSGIKLYTEPEQLQAVHVLVKIAENAPQDKVDQARKRAGEALKKVKAGADFGTVAKEYSDDAMTKEKGGDLGFFRKGVMVPKFEEAAFALKVGEVTKEPVRTPFGFHVIKAVEKKEERIKPFDEVREQIRESLRNRNTFKARRELVESLKAKAKLEIFLAK